MCIKWPDLRMQNKKSFFLGGWINIPGSQRQQHSPQVCQAVWRPDALQIWLCCPGWCRQWFQPAGTERWGPGEKGLGSLILIEHKKTYFVQITGQWSVLLPDGRVQTSTYSVAPDTGFVVRTNTCKQTSEYSFRSWQVEVVYSGGNGGILLEGQTGR